MTIITLEESNGMEHTDLYTLPALMGGMDLLAVNREGPLDQYHPPQPVSEKLIQDLEYHCDNL